MGKMRATVVLDEHLAAKVRQLFDGNLSKGVNTLLERQLRQEKPEESGFGLLKGEGPALMKLRKELREADEKNHEDLYR